MLDLVSVMSLSHYNIVSYDFNLILVIPVQLRSNSFGFVKLKAKSKMPFERDWQNKPRSCGEIQSWLRRQGSNYGVLGGCGDLIVIDADTECLDKVVKDKLPDTFTVRTPKQGHHYYFICKDINNKIVLSKDGEHSERLFHQARK